MKRMYVVLGLFLFTLLWAFTSLGQKKTVDDPEALREEIHRRMRQKLLFGQGSDEDLFRDMHQMMDRAMSDFNTIKLDIDAGVKSEWVSQGQDQILVVTPEDSKQQMDIKVENGLVTLQSKNESKNSFSQFSQSFSIPFGCDGSKVKIEQKMEKIHIRFPCTTRKESREPVQKNEADVSI